MLNVRTSRCILHRWARSLNYTPVRCRRVPTSGDRCVGQCSAPSPRSRAAWLTRARTHQYLIPWARIGKARKETADRETGRKLWEWLENEVKDI